MTNKQVFRVAFDYAERWSPCPDSLEEWVCSTQEIGALYDQNGKDPFLLDLLIAVRKNFDREYKQKGGIE